MTCKCGWRLAFVHMLHMKMQNHGRRSLPWFCCDFKKQCKFTELFSCATVPFAGVFRARRTARPEAMAKCARLYL